MLTGGFDRKAPHVDRRSGWEADTAISDVYDLPDILTGLCQFTASLCGLEAGLWAVCDSQTGQARTYCHGFANSAARNIADMELQLRADAVRRKDPELIDVQDIDRDRGNGPADHVRSLYAKHGLRTIWRIPLPTPDDSPAVIVLGTKNAYYCNEQPAGLMEALASHIQRTMASVLAARAVQVSPQQHLLDASVQLAQQQDVQQMLKLVAETAVRIVSDGVCCLRLLDEDRNDFTTTFCETAESAEGHDAVDDLDQLAWQAVKRSEPVRDSTEAANGPSIALPLTAEGRPIGAMTVARASGTQFDDSQIMALQTLAAQAGVAIHGIRLNEIARRRSEHMEIVAAQAWQEEARARAVFEAATAVTQQNDLQSILADVARSACKEIGFQRAEIYLADYESGTLVGQLRARIDGEPVAMQTEPIPLSADSDNPLAQAAIGTEPYVIDEVQTKENDGNYERLLVPLTTQEQLVGLIAADDRDTKARVSPQKTRLLYALAGLVSVAIERARVQKLRGTLISSVSHELRTPLASIRAYNELVMSGDVGPIDAEQKQYLQRVEESCMRLERLIEDLMHLSKLRSGEMPVNKQMTDVANVVETVIDTMRPPAQDAGVSLELKKHGKIPDIVTDGDRVRQVLTNLIDNAIKFNDEGGWVRVHVRTADDEVTISVEDNGPGIPQSYKATIFEEFHHGTDDASRAKEGAGLGLSIARRIVDMLDGRIWFESQVGEGTTFFVSLPVQQQDQ